MSTHDHGRSASPQLPAVPRPMPREEAPPSPVTEVPGSPRTSHALAGELQRSLHEQPRVGHLRLLVRRDAASGLEAGLTRVLAQDGIQALRLVTAGGSSRPVTPGTSVRSLVAAVLNEGAELVWSMPVASADRMAIAAGIAMTAGRWIAHGAHRWERKIDGSWSRAGAVLAAARPLIVAPPTQREAVTGLQVAIGLPPGHRSPVGRPAIDLPVLPVSAAGFDDRHRQIHALLRRQDDIGTSLAADERAWLVGYARLVAEVEKEQALRDAAVQRAASPSSAGSSVPPSPAARALSPEPVPDANSDLFERDRAKTSNHDVRKAALAELIACSATRPLTAKEDRQCRRLQRMVTWDDEHQTDVDRLLDAAVDRRARLVSTRRDGLTPAELYAPQKPILTKKGAVLICPCGIDPRDQQAMADWLMAGFNRKHGKVTSPMVDFEITWSQDAVMDRAWMAYVVRRICRAIGRDPDLHVYCASHEPGIHPVSKKDGKPIQPHSHVAVLTHNADGSAWRCPNMHLNIQRELESINRERGWSLTTSAVAKGKRVGWYTESGSKRMGWTIDDKFTATDSPAAVLAVAREIVPPAAEARPGAGMVVINRQHSERRVALRRQDLRQLAAAGKVVDRLMAKAERYRLELAYDAGGRVRLRYFTGEQRTSGTLSPEDQLLADLCHAAIRRDAAACALILKRVDYFTD